MAADLKEIRILDEIAKEAANRPTRRSQIEIVPYKPEDPRTQLTLALEGTITLLVARPGNPLMAEIREALATKTNLEAVAKKLYLQYKKRKQIPLARAVKTVVSEPVFADVLYGDRVLQQALFVPEGLVAFVPFPYNGGRLAKGKLTLVEHLASENSDSLDIIALLNAPALTAAERAALALLPPEEAVFNVGFGLGPQACSVVLLVALVVVEAAVVVVTYTITGSIDLSHMQELSDADVRALGPARTARSLVAMRREWLQTNTLRTTGQLPRGRGR